MITPELAYLLKANIAIALFYAFYHLFFKKDTFFHLRRTSLLCFFAISFIYPTLNCQEWIKSHEPMVAMADLYASVVLPEVKVATPTTTSWQTMLVSVLMSIYATGIIIMSARFLAQLFSILRLRIHCRMVIIDKVKVYIPDRANGPFSFFHWIFIQPDAHDKNELSEILTHELAHANQYHSLDVLFSELICIACWFNPFVWLMKREVRNNLEYMADKRVIETGHDSRSYQYHLLGLAHQSPVTLLSNNFNVLSLKNRIRMMNKKRTSEIGRTKYLMFIPLAGLLMIINNLEAVARTTSEIAQEVMQTVKEQIDPSVEITPAHRVETRAPITEPETTRKNVAKTPRQAESEVIFEVTEEMPSFPGGMGALMSYIKNNTRYPEAAHANGKEGRVIVQFIVEKDGKLSNPQVVRSADPEFNAEAIRVIKQMPQWLPGKQKGQTVAVKYTIPVAFILTGQPDPQSRDIEIAVTEAETPEHEDRVPAAPANTVFDVVEEMPEFKGGKDALMHYLASNIKYPVKSQETGEQGRVIVQLVVNKEGKITQPKIVRSVSPALDAEAVRVVSNMPAWKPGRQRGQAVSVKYTVPIMFRLS